MNEFVVDGHNALHRLRLAGRGIAAIRAKLLTRVRAAAPRGAVVFFDGHPGSGEFGGTEDRGLTIRYAGSIEADQAIVDHIRAARHPQRITVITDDLELARRAEQVGAAAMRVGHFFAVLDVPDPDAKPGAAGFSAADFGLPETVDLDRPPGNLDTSAPPGRRPKLPRRRPGF